MSNQNADRIPALIKTQYSARTANPSRVRLKVNVFKAYELEAFCRAFFCVHRPNLSLDSFMVGDSYVSTHLGMPSTLLASEKEQVFYFLVMRDLVHEVRLARDSLLGAAADCYVIADMPHGSLEHTDIGVNNCLKMMSAGAEAIKLEMVSEVHWSVLEELSSLDIPVIAHIGYMPQLGGKKLRGQHFRDAEELIVQSRRARDSGAAALVLEGVSTLVNAVLSRPSARGLPVYSIFSGRPDFAGLSINVWDCFYQPAFRNKHFPPVARRPSTTFPDGYTLIDISDRVRDLLEQIEKCEFPIAREDQMSTHERERLLASDPWEVTDGK